MFESYGPYPEYREVSTSHGVFGVPEGQVLSFDASGAAVFSEAETVITGDGDAEFDVFVAGTTDDEDAVPAPDADDASDEES